MSAKEKLTSAFKGDADWKIVLIFGMSASKIVRPPTKPAVAQLSRWRKWFIQNDPKEESFSLAPSSLKDAAPLQESKNRLILGLCCSESWPSKYFLWKLTFKILFGKVDLQNTYWKLTFKILSECWPSKQWKLIFKIVKVHLPKT